MAPPTPNNGVEVRQTQSEKWLARKMGFTAVPAGRTQPSGQRAILEPLLCSRSLKNLRHSPCLSEDMSKRMSSYRLLHMIP